MKLLNYSWVLLAFSALPAFGTALSVTPGSITIAPGDNLSIDIDVSQVTDLYAFQFDVDFVPGILSASSVTEGAFLQTAGPTTFIPGSIDNAAGSISFNADTLIGSIPGASGSGTLLSIEFEAVSGGTSPITISNVTLLDSTLAAITATANNGAVTVQVGAPEPGALGLVGVFASGVIILKIVRRDYFL